MTVKTGTRTQRRMARRQAMLLFVAVLVVALVSFSLGVMVGRSGYRPPDRPVAGEPLVLPGAKPVMPEPPPVAEPGAGEAAATPPADEKLTFYDTLPRGEQPLGSGINLPRQPVKPPAEAVATIAPSPARSPAAARPEPAMRPGNTLPGRKPEQAAAAPPAAVGYLLQVASFRNIRQAEALRHRLAGKGYAVFVRKADLGGKGVWQRVYVGPYSDRMTAEKAAKQLKQKEKLSPLVRRR